MKTIDVGAFQAVQGRFDDAATSHVPLVVIVEGAPPRGRYIQSQRADHNSQSHSCHRKMAEKMNCDYAFDFISNHIFVTSCYCATFPIWMHLLSAQERDAYLFASNSLGSQPSHALVRKLSMHCRDAFPILMTEVSQCDFAFVAKRESLTS